MSSSGRVLHISPQESFFYQGSWTEEAVSIFVNVLLDNKKRGLWDVLTTNFHAIAEAQDMVNVMLERNYLWDEVVAQRNLLKKRYMTFKQILEVEGTWYDSNINYVHVPDWEKVFEVDEFSKAFYHKGDKLFDQLKSLFSSEHDRSTDTINISSDMPMWKGMNSLHDPFIIADSDDEHEVTSPCVVGRNTQRKLFNEVEPVNMLSVESKTTSAPPTVDKCRGKKHVLPPLSSNPPIEKLQSTTTVPGKNTTSSVSSCSPVKWHLEQVEKE